MIDTKARVEVLEQRMDRLESEITTCALDKDKRISDVHEDMLDLKATVQNLTSEIRDAVASLREIAKNTLVMTEVVSVYEKWKGFAWVMKSVGFWGAIVFAFVAGIVATIIGMR